jgi:hypothetical protein
LAIALISSTVFAVEQLWSLKGPKDTPYTYTLESSNSEPKLYDMFSKEITSLKPGKVLFIFQNKNTPTIVETHFSAQKFNSLEQISQKVGKQRFISPEFLPDEYKFKEANIGSSKISDSFIAELKKECQNENQEYFVRIADLDPNNEVTDYFLIYQKDDHKDMADKDILIRVNYAWSLDEINERKYEQEASKIKVNGFDAILTQSDGMGEIKWLMRGDNTNTYISVSSTSSDGHFSTNDLNNLKRVAESIK